MRWIPFVDYEVLEELDKIPGEGRKEKFAEHSFIATCLRIGLQISDLSLLTYIDILKIWLSINGNNIAQQEDIDKLLG